MSNDRELSAPHIPDSLVVHAVWTPVGEQPGRRRAVYVTEKTRRMVAGVLLLVLLAGLVTSFFVLRGGQLGWTVAIAIAAGIAVVVYNRGGRAGFYELEDDGALGTFIGRQNPDLSDMRRSRAA